MEQTQKINELVKQIHGIKGTTNQLHILAEEAAELIQEISKVMRIKGSRTALVEEIADVLNGLEYAKRAFNITEEELKEKQLDKLERTIKRIERKED
ncbi:MAG: hypothetical protein ACRCX8_01305 [Sarcina sp.]